MAKILVIEDEEPVRRAICEMLAHGGYEVLEAIDGVEGLAMVRAHRPDAVVTDLMMPNKEGFETIRDLRRVAPDMPVLVMSGNSGSALYLQMATLLGAHSTLAKPFRASELLAAVADLLKPGNAPA